MYVFKYKSQVDIQHIHNNNKHRTKMSSISSENDFSDSSTDDEIENINEVLVNLQPYRYEPCSQNDDDETDGDTSSEESCDDEKAHSERVGNKDWCKCSFCKIEIRDIDCLCCQEVEAILEESFEGNECITLSKEFQTLCLETTVLKNVLVGLHESKGDPLEDENEIKNRSLRFAAYKQFVWWVFHRLGKGNRRVLPSCVLWCIRKKFPEANGQYVRFKEGQRD